MWSFPMTELKRPNPYRPKDIKEEKRSVSTLINIGAHVGSTCIPAIKSKLFKQAIAFEPFPINFKLLESGWKVMTIWECELKKEYLVKKKIKDFVFEQ